jgi:hypothetical protein
MNDTANFQNVGLLLIDAAPTVYVQLQYLISSMLSIPGTSDMKLVTF